jgi:uncharacterized protein with HEPN domain
VSRDWRLYWDDILIACRKITRFVSGLDKDAFLRDERTYDAVLRNLEVVGEAAKKVPDEVRGRAPGIEWRKIGGLRDIIAHGYFGVDNEILWNVVIDKIPELLRELESIDLDRESDASD